MPTYEYVCENGHRIEVFRRISDPPPTTCEVCGASLRKVFHPAGILFKGSGFYSTDNRSKKAASAGEGKDDKAKKPEPAGAKGGKDGGAKTGSASGGETTGSSAGEKASSSSSKESSG